MSSYLSPRYTDSDFPAPLSIDNAITIFEDQVRGWFLDISEKLTEHVGADFVTLMVITSYFEGFEILHRGEDSKNRSDEFFRAGFNAVVPVIIFLNPVSTEENVPVEVSDDIRTEIAGILYDQLRCGIFHAGMTRYQIGLSRDIPAPVSVNKSSDGMWLFSFNVPQLLFVVRQHFRQYLAELRNYENLTLRENFRRGWNIRVARKDKKSTPLTVPDRIP